MIDFPYNFLITGLCNSRDSSSFTLISTPVFLSKTCKPYLSFLFGIQHI